MGDLPRSRNRKKKVLTSFGRVELSKEHKLCPSGTFSISVHMQDLICYAGQSLVYEEASCLLEKALGISISGMQIQRMSLYYGEQLNELINCNCESVIPSGRTSTKEDTAYVMMDGAMIYTRDHGWKR